MMDWLALWGSLLGLLLGSAGVIYGLRTRSRYSKSLWGSTMGRVAIRSREQLVIEFETPEGRRTVAVRIRPPFPLAAMPEEYSLGAELSIRYRIAIPAEGFLITEKLPEYALQWLSGNGWMQSELDWYTIPVSTLAQIGGGILLLFSIFLLAVALHYLL